MLEDDRWLFEELIPRSQTLLLQRVDIVWEEPFQPKYAAFFTRKAGSLLSNTMPTYGLSQAYLVQLLSAPICSITSPQTHTGGIQQRTTCIMLVSV